MKSSSKINVPGFFSNGKIDHPPYDFDWYCLPRKVGDIPISDKKITIKYGWLKKKREHRKIKIYIDGIGRVKPFLESNSICLAGFSRKYEPGTGSYLITTLPVPGAISLKDIRRFYSITKKMGLVSPYVTRKMFENMVHIINLDEHSNVFAYVSISNSRFIRDDVGFVKKFLYLIDKGIDPFVAYTVCITFTANTGHHFINRYHSFMKGGVNTGINVSIIAGLYRLFKKKEHLELPPINETDGKRVHFSIANKIEAYVGKYDKMKAGAMLTYANTLAASVKLTSRPECKPNTTLKLMKKAEETYEKNASVCK